jgi:hypothetical protein
VGGAGAVLLAGTLTLLGLQSSPVTTVAMPDHVARNLSDVPAVGREVARTSLELVVTNQGHLSTAAALVVDHGHVAVTTLRISPAATVTGSSRRTPRERASWLGYDAHLGLTFLRLSVPQVVTPLAALPASQSVLALSPYFQTSSVTPSIAYADTVLSDPRLATNDHVVSYLASSTPDQLHGLPGALAVNDRGRVVAVLGRNRQWYAADYVARVASSWLTTPNCHGRLGVLVTNAQGGGVLVTAVPAGPASGRLMPGDVIIGLQHADVDSVDRLTTTLFATPAHVPVRVTFVRHGATASTVVTLGCQA